MRIVLAKEMKKLDNIAMEKFSVPGIVLMENAAKAVADKIIQIAEEKKLKKIIVLCGKGNNGGDGFGTARWLMQYGYNVKVLLVDAKIDDVKNDAAVQMKMYLNAGGEIETINQEEDCQLAEVMCLKADLVVDAMLGTGFTGELNGIIQHICTIINECRCCVVAIDIPSGVNADNGSTDNNAIRADYTVTMALVKAGMLLYPAKSYIGKLICADIGIPEKVFDICTSKKYLLTNEIIKELLPVRRPDAHKGDAGKVIVAAGSPGYTGAAALTSFAAVKSGAGLVSLLTPLSCRDILSTKLTEVMVQGLIERMPGILGGGAASDIVSKAEQADVLAVGPGLGTSEYTLDVIREVLKKASVPVVIDADAITALKNNTDILQHMSVPKVITPHMGELARILKMDADEIAVNRIAVVEKYAQEWNTIIVLKGAPTIIGCPDGSVYINITGCNAMATGGSGDVLTGIIAGLAAQCISLQEAVLCAVYLHGLAGEAASDKAIGLAAGEISLALPKVHNNIEHKNITNSFVYNYALNVIE